MREPSLVATNGKESMSASKLVALFPRTEVLGPKEREVPCLAGDQLEMALARLNRLGMMGELAASLAHEIITQPIAAARNNAIAAMRFLDRNPPDLGEVREALECIVADADRAGDIIGRIRASANESL
jgi:phosphoglycerate-specific signal transduction histidine kinase